MSNCKDCKHWGVQWSRSCDKVNLMQLDASTEFWVDATSSDDTGLEAFLMTGPMFGCLHFDLKENNNET